jgi:hypothetical protein
MHLKAIGFALISLVPGCATGQDRAAADSAVFVVKPVNAPASQGPMFAFSNPQLEDATLAAYLAIGDLPRLPEDAQHIYLVSENAPDGFIFIVSYESNLPAPQVFCEMTCIDANRVSGSLPELWPTREELHAPAWLADLSGQEGWATASATPHSVEMYGRVEPCGFSRASGRGVFSEHSKSRTTVVDYSLQWFRVGCGG